MKSNVCMRSARYLFALALTVLMGAQAFAQDRITGFLFGHALIKATGLNHEAWNYPVKYGATIKTAVDVGEKILHRYRRFISEQAHGHITVGGAYYHFRIPGFGLGMGQWKEGDQQAQAK